MPEIVLPLPPRELSPNYKPLISAAKWGPARDYRSMVGWMTKGQMQEQGLSPVWGCVDLKLCFHFRNRRRRDKDNLLASFKPGIDGMIDAALFSDDSADHINPVIEVLDGCDDEGVYVTW